MKKYLVFALLVAIISPLTAQVGTKNFIDQPYVEVTGRAEMELVPDLIYLKVIIDEKDNKAKESMEALERKMLNALEKIGLDLKKDVAVIDLASNFQDHWIKKTGIRTSKEYEVLAHTGKTVGQIFMSLEQLGISNISVARLDHSKIEEYRRQVKINAVKAAKEKANDLMEAIGQGAGKAIYVQEINRGYYPSRMEANTMMRVQSSAMDKSYEVDMEFQKLKLEYEIQARFAIDY